MFISLTNYIPAYDYFMLTDTESLSWILRQLYKHWVYMYVFYKRFDSVNGLSLSN